MLETLDHVIVAVRNLKAAEGIWARLLGRRPSWRGEHPGSGTANVLFRLQNTYLELLAPEGDGRLTAWLQARLDSEGEGMLGAAFGTPDAEACFAAWERAGLHPAPVEKGLGRDVQSGAFREWRSVMLPGEDTRGALVFAIEHLSPAEVLPPATALGDEPACVSGLDHAVLRTADPEAAVRLYGEALGIRLALDREFPQWGARMQFFRLGGITWEVVSQLEDGESATREPDRLWGLSFRVPDAEAARKRLLDWDFEVSELREGRKPGTRVLTVKGPTCGVPTLLLEPGS